MSLIVGSRLGPYELIASLGAGGMGEVYRARDAKLDRDVAIKVLPEAFVADADRVARFQREARTLASLSHPNIAVVYGLEQVDQTHALVMELVEGEDLSQRIARGPVPLDEALTIATQIAAALAAAHEQGIVHRDLKPANVRIRHDGTAKVLDFGLARAFAEDSGATSVSMSPTITTPAMTQAGVILGTAAYMAPEQARGKVVDKRADIWAFGVVLYEMLTGHRPFKGDDIGEVLASVIKENPALDSVPARVRPLLERCLQKDPRKRLRDIGDMDLLLAASEPQKSPTGHGLWWLGWAAAAVFAAGSGVAVWAPWRTGTPLPPPHVVRFQAPFPDDVTGAQGFALSPDGRSIAADAVGADSIRRIWLRTTDSLEWRSVPGTERGSNPFWSPDGHSLGFLAGQGNAQGTPDAKLKKIAVAGGDAQVICDVFVGAGIAQTAASWGRGDVILFSSGTSASGANRPVVWRVAATGGTPSPVTVLNSSEANEDHRAPLFLPDGDHFLYLVRSSGNSGIYLGSLRETQQPSVPWLALATRRLGGNLAYTLSPDGKTGYLLFLPEGTLMAQPFDADTIKVRGDAFPVVDGVARLGGGVGVFTASARGAIAYRSGAYDREMTLFDRDGNVLGTPGFAGAAVNLSRDGRRTIATVDADLWLWDLQVPGRKTRLTTDAEPGDGGVWSRDGERIAYARGNGLYVKPAVGGKVDVLFDSTPGPKVANDWSPGDRLLLYSAYNPVTQWDLWVLPLTGERKPVRVADTKGNEVRGQFSPDGRWIAYSSDQSGTREIYLREFSEANPASGKAVPLNNGDQPRWRGDGSELYYRGRGMARAGAVEAESEPRSGRGERGRGAIPIVVLQMGRDGSMATGAPRVLFNPKPGPGPGNGSNAYYDVTPDGQHFLINTFVEGNLTAPLTVVLNWAASIKP